MAGEDALLIECRAAAVALFGLKEPLLARLPGGRVNESFIVTSLEGRFVLQRLNEFFLGPLQFLRRPEGPENKIAPNVNTAVGENWRAVYLAVLERSGQGQAPLPPIYPDLNGRWLACFPEGEGETSGFWRLTGFLEGLPAPKSPAGAREAAKMLGFFHRHLNLPRPIDLTPLPEGEFTNQHLSCPREFERIYGEYHGHPQLEELKPLIDRAMEAAAGFMARPGFAGLFSLRNAIIHGDPKADNYIFSPDGRALALLDWDSVGPGNVLIDVAELLRSWGYLSSEGEADIGSMAAVVEGYAQGGLALNPDEVEMLPAVVRAIALNLCRRYLVDALAQLYFKWNEAAYTSLFHQNRARAEVMLTMVEHLADMEAKLGALLAESYLSASPLRQDRRDDYNRGAIAGGNTQGRI